MCGAGYSRGREPHRNYTGANVPFRAMILTQKIGLKVGGGLLREIEVESVVDEPHSVTANNFAA